MSNLFDDYLNNKLENRKEAGNYRQLPLPVPFAIDFNSSDYLGFTRSKSIYNENSSNKLNGATGARLLSGNNIETTELEKHIAHFHNTEAALLFNSGYSANMGLLTAIANRHTVYIYDELCHASLIDGVKLSQAKSKFKFRHNDVNHLESLIKRNRNAPICVIVESVYSMDGDYSPLEEIVGVLDKYNAILIVDEAHATGVYGEKGQGRVQELNLQEKVWARVHTFGKALGLHGAAIVGSKLLINSLINFSRPFIYTTALPEDSIMKIKAIYDHLSASSNINIKLHQLIKYFRRKVSTSEKEWLDSDSPIQGIILGNNADAKRLGVNLQNRGIGVYPILSPTVAQGEERIRISLHDYNTIEEVDLLFSVINDYRCKEH